METGPGIIPVQPSSLKPSRSRLAAMAAVMRRDEDVDGKDELFAYRPADGIVPFGPVVEGCGDDEEIDVAVGAGVAAGVAAEEDDLLRVEFLGDQLGNGLNCRPVDRDFCHLRETSLRMFCHALD